ncbi:GNAT family N-acetyltransferase [Desulfatitalea tepidiphila]|uniref:GNAT family N-acetyltransferase n=1 Tax=Desulfatitalea tepidiphila TaxID=1185843 RepID=UPI0006B51A00|nr:GNAT family N-acetyltransferase [Desulfatitalea tepidiphila]
MPHPEADILLVQPPVHHPACYSTLLLRVAAVLQRDGHTIRRFHAGAGYFNYVVGNARVQADLQARVAERLQGGDDQGAEDGVRRKVLSRATEICVAGLTFREDPALLQGSPDDPDWADLSESVRRLDGLDKVLDLVSVACHPARIDRRGCVWPGLDDEQALAAYLVDSQHNPFFDYAGEAEVPDIASGRCAAVAVMVSAPGQMVGALTLARRWQRRWPTVAIAVCAAWKDWGTAAERLWAQLREPAADRVAALVHRAMDQAAAEMATPIQGAGPCSEAGSVRRLASAGVPSLSPSPAQSGGRVIVWEKPSGPMADISRLLFQSAKQGHWNHLVFTSGDDPELTAQIEQFANENPYIIHSWCRYESPLSRYSDEVWHFPEESPPYGATRPMAGRPVWMRLQDPVYLQTCVRTHGAKGLARQRLGDDGRLLPEVGSRLVYRYLPPDQLPSGYFDEICRMVEAGGTVGSQWLRHNLQRAYLIGYAEEDDLIAGNSSLKRPREEYVDAVSAQCGIDLHNYLERGYTSVRPEYRSLGIGAKLLEGLTERAGSYKIYSVIAEDNVATQKMAIRNRTRKVAAFFSERTRKQIGIWVPEWMLPEDFELPPQPDLS